MVQTNKEQLLKVLQDLGLSDNEAQIYLAALSLGPTTVLKLAQAAGMKRPSVYGMVRSLQEKGLLHIELAGLKQRFVAENPQNLESVFEARREKFRALLPEFSALYNLKGGESFLKYYEGLDAVKGVYESLIRDVRPHEDYLVFVNQEQWHDLDPKYFMDFTERRAKLPIKIRQIFQDTPIAYEWKPRERNYNTHIRILPPDVKLRTNLVITPQRVLIHQLSPPILGIVIENKSVIQMHREMYEIIWNSLPE